MLFSEDATMIFITYVNLLEVLLLFLMIKISLYLLKSVFELFKNAYDYLRKTHLIPWTLEVKRMIEARRSTPPRDEKIDGPIRKKMKLDSDHDERFWALYEEFCEDLSSESTSWTDSSEDEEETDLSTDSNGSDDWTTIGGPSENVGHLEIREAVRRGDLEAVREQLLVVDPNEPCPCNDPDCLSPLWEAALTKQLDMIELLINSGANVHESLNGKYILEVVSTLEIDLDQHSLGKLVVEEYEGWMLVEAVNEGKVKLIELLLRHGGKVHEILDSMARHSFPIQLLAAQSKAAKDIVPLFIEHKVNITVKDTIGMNMLHYLIENKNLTSDEVVKLAEMLIDAGLPVDETDVLFGFTALHIAEICENEDLVSLLVKRGAEVNQKSNAGYSPMDLRHRRVTSREDLSRKELDYDA